MIKIALAQLNFTVGAIYKNCEKMLSAIEQAKDAHADLIAFPELAIPGYPAEDLLLRPDFNQHVEQAVKELVKNIHGIDAIITYPEKKDGHLYNAAAWVRNRKIIATYYKQELPNQNLLDEKRYFTEGNLAVCVNLKGIEFGLLICEDLWHAAPILLAKKAGAQCIISPNASPFRCDKQQHRIHTLQTRAKHAKLPILYVNHVGSQDEFLFDGQATAINADGDIAAMADAFSEELFFIQFDGKKTEKQDYQNIDGLNLIYQGLVVATRDYILKNHFPGAIIGLSGGIDSALTLAIAVDAIGADKIHAVFMPSQYSVDISLHDAKQQAAILGVKFDIIPIKETFDSFLNALDPVFKGLEKDTTEENIQARIRGTLLMALSNKTGSIVLSTGNKSEMAVGYATLYGDMAGGFAVLKDVYKMTVYELAHFCNREKMIIPERVITRPPSAELAPDQKDQDSLPPYDILDAIIKAFVEDRLSCNEIIALGYEADTVKRVLRLIQINEYKRRQSPPGTRITKRAFGRNRRYPITSGFINISIDEEK